MKVRHQILISVLFLAFGATLAGAAPATLENAAPAREGAPVADTRPADIFGVSFLNGNKDCGVAQLAAKPVANGTSPWLVCGTCSVNICDGAPVNSICGYSGGKFLRCQDWLGSLCPLEDGAACRCSSAPIP